MKLWQTNDFGGYRTFKNVERCRLNDITKKINSVIKHIKTVGFDLREVWLLIKISMDFTLGV